jgi:hypothetical protein
VGLNPTRDRSQWDAATPCQAWCGTHRTQLADAFRLPRPDLAGPRMPVLLCVSASHFFRRSPFFPQLPLLPFFTSLLSTSTPKPLFRLRLRLQPSFSFATRQNHLRLTRHPSRRAPSRGLAAFFQRALHFNLTTGTSSSPIHQFYRVATRRRSLLLANCLLRYRPPLLPTLSS